MVEYPVNVFPEYSNRSFQSLLWELMQVVPDEEKKEIADAFQESKKLTALFILQTGAAAPKPTATPTAKRQRKDLLESNENVLKEDESRLLGVIGLKFFNLERWGKPLSSIADK